VFVFNGFFRKLIAKPKISLVCSEQKHEKQRFPFIIDIQVIKGDKKR